MDCGRLVSLAAMTSQAKVVSRLRRERSKSCCYERAAGLRPDDPDPLNELGILQSYASADFREHALCFSLEPALAAHDHKHFEIFCYADVPRPDAVTQRLQGCADLGRWLVGLSDAQAAELIRQDGINILFLPHPDKPACPWT
jgi:hypothetical protein